MKFVKCKIAHVFAIVALSCSAIVGQMPQPTVKLEFKVDKKVTHKKIRIIFYVKGVATEPRVSNDGRFLLPALNAEWVDVRVISGKYDLLYEHIFLKKLAGGPLIFRVFTSHSAFNRLSDTDSKCLPGQKLIKAYDLDFNDGTQVTVTACK